MKFEGLSKRPGKFGQVHATLKLTTWPQDVDLIADVVRLCDRTNVLIRLRDLVDEFKAEEVILQAKMRGELK